MNLSSVISILSASYYQYAGISLGNIITTLAILSSLLMLWLNSKKLGDTIKKETEWRVTVNKDMAQLLEKVTELLSAHKIIDSLVKGLLESKLKHEHEIELLRKEISALWKRIDENKVTISQNANDIKSLMKGNGK